MGQNTANENGSVFVEDLCDEPVFVSADVEYRVHEVADLYPISMGVDPPYVCEAIPASRFRGSIPRIKLHISVPESRSGIEQLLSGNNVHRTLALKTGRHSIAFRNRAVPYPASQIAKSFVK
jgi:hypothetical protein